MIRRALLALAAVGLGLIAAPPASAQNGWRLKVGSWNVWNFSSSKARSAGGRRVNLMAYMGQIATAYDVIVFQEVLQDGSALINDLLPYMPGYGCQALSAPSGRAGRQERYVVCSKANNATGTIAVGVQRDYAVAGGTFQAGDGSQQPVGNVWSRPPLVAQVVYTPNDATYQPVTISLYTIHAMPNYAAAKPPGTPAGARVMDSVHYELQAIGNNLTAGAAGVKRMVIGDLNADCDYYPARFRNPTDLSVGWTWYLAFGQKTNAAPGSSCAYDRVILNTALNSLYLSHGVDYPGYVKSDRLDGKGISDHYPIWVVFGQQPSAKPVLTAAAAAPVTTGNAQKKFKTSNVVQMGGAGLPASKAGAKLFVTAATTTHRLKTNTVYQLSDVRGAPTPVSTDANGTMQQTVAWSSPVAGAYTMVFDANGDGQFRLSDGDFANEDAQADYYVGDVDAGHNSLVTLGDNMVSRDVFDLNQAQNIYLLGKNLPPTFNGNAYVISTKLLNAAGYSTWAQARAARIDLGAFAIPLQRAGSGAFTTAELTLADKQQPFRTNADGELFLSVWPRPAQLMNATVDYQSPPDAVFPTKPVVPDPPSSPDDTEWSDDACADAALSQDTSVQAACNIGFGFGDYYGHSFNVVLDIDGDGKLGPTDPVDTRDVGDMLTFFGRPGATALGPSSNGDPAVSEWKEYLSRALSLDLSADNTYDADTLAASRRYACGSLLSKAAFQNWIVPDAETGFRVLDDATYRRVRATATGLYQYDVATLNGLQAQGAQVCVTGGDLTYAGPVDVANSSVTVTAPRHEVLAPIRLEGSSTMCMAASEAKGGLVLLLGAGAALLSGPAAPIVFLASLGVSQAVAVKGAMTCSP